MSAESSDARLEELAEGLEGQAREARLRLLHALRDDGATLEELREAVAEDRLVFLPAERRLGGVAQYTGRELIEDVGLDADFVQSLRRANGLPVPDPDAIAYAESDREALGIARAFLDAGVEQEDIMLVTRTLGRGLAQAAEAMRAITLDLVLEPGTSEDELAMRFAEVAGRLQPLVGPMLDQMLRAHLRQVVRTELVTATEREAGRLPGARDVGIAFADLVGFTRMGEQVPPDALGDVAERLEVLAAEHVEPPARLVKTIGDAVMLASPEVPALLGSTFALVQAADREGAEFPQLRAGAACGPALSRAGDWYGRPVNLASRITSIARPGSLLVTREVREHAGDGWRFSRAGERQVKGIRERVALYRARPADGGEANGDGDASRPPED